jgi:histidine triad (HIT) family protein
MDSRGIMLASMNPRNTIFDRIVRGELPASFVHQDEVCVAFLDINPITEGHTLVVPRQSVATLDELDPGTRHHLWNVVQRIGRAQRQGLGSRAQHLLVNDGKAASQTVPHVHIHVIPRYAGDTLKTVGRMIWHVTTLTVPRRETAARRKQFDDIATRIKTAMDDSQTPES